MWLASTNNDDDRCDHEIENGQNHLVGPPRLKRLWFSSRFERGGTIRYSLYKETTESMNEKEDMKQIVKVVYLPITLRIDTFSHCFLAP